MDKKGRRKTSSPLFRGASTRIKSGRCINSLFLDRYEDANYLRTSSLDWSQVCMLVRRALAPQNFSRRKHEETEGFLTYRIADRRGDHSDHRGYRYPELAQSQDGGE